MFPNHSELPSAGGVGMSAFPNYHVFDFQSFRFVDDPFCDALSPFRVTEKRRRSSMPRRC